MPPTGKAGVMNYHYRKTYCHNLNKMLENDTLRTWWEDMSNKERTYVLKGRC